MTFVRQVRFDYEALKTLKEVESAVSMRKSIAIPWSRLGQAAPDIRAAVVRLVEQHAEIVLA